MEGLQRMNFVRVSVEVVRVAKEKGAHVGQRESQGREGQEQFGLGQDVLTLQFGPELAHLNLVQV